MTIRTSLFALTALALGAGPAAAQTLDYYTELDGQQAASGLPGVGFGTFVIDTVANTCDYHIEHMGMTNNESAAHIHGPAPPGVAAGIGHFLPVGPLKIGTWDYPEEVEADLLAGLYYVNIHSHEVLPGEMRGQIVPTPLRYCACDGGGPCGNVNPGGGCANSVGAGARVEYTGLPSVILDTLSPRVEGMAPGQFGIFYIGPNTLQLPFGDGERCVGGTTIRLPVQIADGAGTLVQPPGMVALTGAIDPGETWHTQCWYRDPGGPCGAAFNLSDALSIAFTP